MKIDTIQQARQKRDLTICEALGIDPTISGDMDVDLEHHQVYWMHASPKPYPEGAVIHRIAKNEFITLRRESFTLSEWRQVKRAELEFRKAFNSRIA